jgi:hypothetical protein
VCGGWQDPQFGAIFIFSSSALYLPTTNSKIANSAPLKFAHRQVLVLELGLE